MSKDLIYKMDHRKIRPVKRLWYFLGKLVCKIMTRKVPITYHYEFDKKKYKNKQIILISDHASRDTFWATYIAGSFTRINYVSGYQNFFKDKNFKLLSLGGNIPKWLYQADLRATKEMLKVIKMGGSIGLFVEGIQSTSGSTHPMNPATIKFFKKCNLPIVLVSTKGFYLNRPRFSDNYRYGPVEVYVKELVTQDEIITISEEDLYQRYLEMFSYNDFEWNKKKHYEYIGDEPNATGINNILYRCPKCGSEFRLMVEGDTLYCHHCRNSVKIDSHYDLIPLNDSYMPYRTIDEWYKDQRKHILREIKDENLKIEFEVKMQSMYTDKPRKNPYYDCGEGKMILTKDGLHYIGSYKGENVDRMFDIKGLPSIPFTPGEGFEFYYDNEFYTVIIKDHPEIAVKLMMLVEEFHNLQDPSWNKASRDVYDK